MTEAKKARLIALIGLDNPNALKRSLIILCVGLLLVSAVWAGREYLHPASEPISFAEAIPNIPDSTLWINSDPINFDTLQNKVILLEIWTFSCINCRRTIPFVKGWNAKYRDSGLLVIGVHCPEYSSDAEIPNLREAIMKHEITYPVVADNDFHIWNYFRNHWWPRVILIGKDKRILYDHIGEGSYDATEQAIRSALALP